LDLLAAPANLPRKALLARLAQRLCDNLGLSETAAQWSIESWALALGIISDAEIIWNESAQETEKGILQQAKSAASTVSAKAAKITKDTRQTPPANVFIVSANGSGHFTGISEALHKTPPNSRLLVREGLYDESLILDRNVEIIGDGAVENIIVRSINSSAVVMQTDRAIVRGLTLQGRGARNGKAFFAVEISNGDLILENCDITSDSLSGVAVYGSSSNPRIKNCRIHDCSDSGFYIFDNARAQIENCDIYRNANVSIAITNGATPALKKCRIYDGENGGIVAWGNGAAGTIEDCEIYGHRLANVGVREYANPTFRRCKIFGGNDTGVFVHENGYGIFEECDIYQNAEAQVGISQSANSVFRRCSVHSGENSGIVLQNKGRALIEACRVYDNADAGIAIYGESAATIAGCNIHRNGKVGVRVMEQSAARVENCDLRENFLAAWETEFGVVLEKTNNREF
jgi:F-box protein 11